MKNSGLFKKSFQNFGIFLILLVFIGIIIIPCYANMLASVKVRTIESFDKHIENSVSIIESEINLQKGLLKSVAGEQDFKILSAPYAYGIHADSIEWYKSREQVRMAFSILQPALSATEESFIAFYESDLRISADGGTDKYKASYGNSWVLTSAGEKCSPDYADMQFFYKHHDGGLAGNVAYVDIADNQNYDMVYISTLSTTDGERADSVFVACFDVESFVEGFGFNGDADAILITSADDKKIYVRGREYDISSYDSCCTNEELGVKIYYNISEHCLEKQAENGKFFLQMCILVFVILGFVATVGLSFAEQRRIKKLIELADGVADIEFSYDDDHYKYIEIVMKKLFDSKNQYLTRTRELVYTKLLAFKLSESEYQSIEEDFKAPVSVLLVKNTQPKYHTALQNVQSFLKNNDAELLQALKVSGSEYIFFIKLTNSVPAILSDMIVFLNNEHHADLRGTLATCENVNDMPLIFDKMKKTVQYLEYGSLNIIKNIDKTLAPKDFGEFILKSKQLYEIIISGNEFEAKRIVYEQWYTITQGDVDAAAIEPLFFSQTSILSQISAERKLGVTVPDFDSRKDAVSIAFEITECIEQICQRLQGNGMKKVDVRGSQIVEYIEQRYCDSSFYMPELVGKFELSDRAIVQMLKKTTGENFSNYLGKLRINKAVELLSTTNIAISEVASASGFDSANSLYKAFKKVYGVSPTVYRENRKTENR